MNGWSIDKYEIDLKTDWTIARSKSLKKVIYRVNYEDSGVNGSGEVAFNSHYGESEEVIEKAFDHFKDHCPERVTSPEDLHHLMNEQDVPKSLRAGIENAIIHFLSHLNDTTPHAVLGTNKIQRAATSFSIPIMDIHKVGPFIKEWKLERFSSLKIKIGGVEHAELIHEVHKYFKGPLRIDGNECFKTASEVLDFCEKIKDLPIEFLEQPLPTGAYEEGRALKKSSPFLLIADESILDGPIQEGLKEFFDGINVKIMKTGGYLKAVKQLRDAKNLGMKTMVGCMIETSLGISSAMNIAHGCDFIDLDGFLFLEKDPHSLVIEENGNLFYSNTH